MGIQIVIDSTTDLPAQAAEQVKIVPLTIHFGEQQYVSGVDIDARSFYEKLVESDVLPTTSQPTPAAFADVFQAAVEAGDEVVCITISSKLSGTFQSASIAAMDFPGKVFVVDSRTVTFQAAVEAGDEVVCITISSKLSGTFQSASIAAMDFPGKVFVVDSRTVTLGCGILTQYALDLAKQDISARELAQRVEKKREKVRLLALLDTLEYLKKGGRISATVAFAGGLLNIKPVICVAEGEVKLLGKARGFRQGSNLLVQQIEKAGGVDFDLPVLLGYTGLSDAMLKKYMEDSAQLWQGRVDSLPVSIVGSVVGTHAGPGAVAVAFFSAGE